MMMRGRCLLVSLAATAAGAGAAVAVCRVLYQMSAAMSAGPDAVIAPDEALAGLCALMLLPGIAVLWLQVLAGVAEAWRLGSATPGGASPHGAPPAARGVVRRLVLTACGVAVTGAMLAPAGHAHEARQPPPALTPALTSDALSGLPLPERATQSRDLLLVRPGDSLWALAAADLAPDADVRRVIARSQQIYRLNIDVIGDDPDLIRPGQPLRLPALSTKEQL